MHYVVLPHTDGTAEAQRPNTSRQQTEDGKNNQLCSLIL